jgi:hypothetical protein
LLLAIQNDYIGAAMNQQSEPLTLSPREAAPMVPMGINQFYAAVREGVVPSLRIGKSIRIEGSDAA